MKKLSIVITVLMVCSLFAFASCGDDTGKLTLEKYNMIENGMTYEEVIDIIGGEGTMGAESGEKGTEYYTVIYMYQDSKQVVGSLGANASFTFQGTPLKLEMKAQLGLK
ncbi:MAG: hypothetical protein FWG69_02625 [Oscillospiraceae bacterium]|nr:hypothetical protein [Oscillospiraceae bacterium]